jgi:hypothetical protein
VGRGRGPPPGGHGLTDVNKNPNAPETVPPANLLANAEYQTVAGTYGVNGIWYNLYLAETWSQQIAEAKYNDEDNYIPRPTQLSGVWNSIYAGPLKDLDQIKKYAAAGNDAQLGAVADVLMQLNFQVLTDTYGDIPYSQALKADSGVTAPKYDTQKDVYYAMLAHLTQDAAALSSGSSGSWGSGDFIYGGSLSKWRKFANSLRMRMAMRLAQADPAKAQSEFVAAYNAGGFTSNADNAALAFGSNQPDQAPYYDYWYNQNRSGDFVLAATLVDSLQLHHDPRLQVYAAPATGGVYRGLPNGTLPGDYNRNVPDYSTVGSSLLAPDAPSYLMTYAEVSFLEAEAAARGWIAGSPATFYQQGITASMQQYGISGSAITTYLADPKNAYAGLPSIWMQKWIALFGNGPEAWAEVRQNNYPNVTPAPGFNTIPQRLTYPSEEQLLNSANWSAAVSNNGGKSLFDKMWWDRT